MNFSAIKPCDIANGTGVRVSLFVSGCRRHCPGCFNSSTWRFGAGRPFTEGTEEHILRLLAPDYIRGLSVLGGEPFEPENRAVLAPFLERVRADFPSKDVWCWTGFTLEEVEADAECRRMLGCIDVLVDGPFVQAERDISLAWRGSRNQRIIRFGDRSKEKDERPRDDEAASEDGLPGQRLVQDERGEDDGQRDAQLVERGDLRRVPKLEGAEIEQP